MKTGLLKNFNVFMASVIVFILVAFYCGCIYYSYNQPLQPVAGKDIVNIEVSLPVLEWAKYMGLSKKLNMSADLKVKRKVVDNMPVDGVISPYR